MTSHFNMQEKISLTRKSTIFLLGGLLAYVIFLYFFVDFGAVASAIQRANALYYMLAFIAAVANILFHALIWRTLLHSLLIRPSFQKIISFFWIGSFVDILVPAESVSGEIARAYLMNKNSDGATGRITASIISHRVIYTATSLIALVIGSIFFNLQYGATQPLLALIIIMIIGASISLLFLILLCLKKELVWKIINSLTKILDSILRGRWHLSSLKPKAKTTLNSFYKGIKIISKRPKSWMLSIIFAIIAWFFNFIITYFIFTSLDVIVPVSAMLVVFSIVDALQAVPLGIPGEVGLIEIAMTALYTAIGVQAAVSASVTILVRSVTMWFKLVTGGIIFHRVRTNKKGIL